MLSLLDFNEAYSFAGVTLDVAPPCVDSPLEGDVSST